MILKNGAVSILRSVNQIVYDANNQFLTKTHDLKN